METSPKQNSGLAIASLVLGIVGLLCCGIITGIPAVICGFVARGKIRKDSSLSGEGLATAGLVLGFLSLITTAIFFVVGTSAVKGMKGVAEFGQTAIALTEAQKIQGAMQKMEAKRAATGDKTLGYPADAGITTVTELKEQLIKGEYVTIEELESMNLGQFQIGNVSASDPDSTVFIRAKQPGPGGIIFYLPKVGEMQAQVPGEEKTKEPAREPKYLSEE